jgi:hypothetical protein
MLGRGLAHELHVRRRFSSTVPEAEECLESRNASALPLQNVIDGQDVMGRTRRGKGTVERGSEEQERKMTHVRVAVLTSVKRTRDACACVSTHARAHAPQTRICAYAALTRIFDKYDNVRTQ